MYDASNEYKIIKDNIAKYNPNSNFDFIKKAGDFAIKYHDGQNRASGEPFIVHPFNVAIILTEIELDDEAVAAGLLHDTVEDTDITLNDLKSYGFPAEVLEALSLMTHDDDVDYFDYVKRLAPNPIARKVKLADLRHNSDLTRINNVTEKDLARVEKYRKAIEYLESFDGK